jgi:hypothetical protein
VVRQASEQRLDAAKVADCLDLNLSKLNPAGLAICIGGSMSGDEVSGNAGLFFTVFIG